MFWTCWLKSWTALGKNGNSTSCRVAAVPEWQSCLMLQTVLEGVGGSVQHSSQFSKPSWLASPISVCDMKSCLSSWSQCSESKLRTRASWSQVQKFYSKKKKNYEGKNEQFQGKTKEELKILRLCLSFHTINSGRGGPFFYFALFCLYNSTFFVFIGGLLIHYFPKTLPIGGKNGAFLPFVSSTLTINFYWCPSTTLWVF